MWVQEGLRSLALAPLGEAEDRGAVDDLLRHLFGGSALAISIYRDETG